MSHGNKIHNKGWVKEGSIYRADILASKPSLVHGFTTRATGDLLDEGIKRVLARREGFEEILTLKQVHGNAIVPTVESKEFAEADGWFGQPGQGFLFGIKTADCLPILIHHEESGLIAALHAGWRSAVAGICERATALFESEGASMAGLSAALGPSIGPCCFEVGADVYEAAGKDARFFETIGSDKHLFDLPLYAAMRLSGAGVPLTRISISGLCTVCNEEEFFSHRRSKEKERMCAFVGMR